MGGHTQHTQMVIGVLHKTECLKGEKCIQNKQALTGFQSQFTNAS